MTIGEMVKDLKEKMNELDVLVVRFEEKKIKSAGSKARKLLQEIKNDIKPIRDKITEIKNAM
jgi:hypothetical protein